MNDAPIDMILHCPACGLQHIDEPEGEGDDEATVKRLDIWTNPPHRSHLCHGCGHVWRPADVPTNGVAAIKTRGKNDSPAHVAAGPAFNRSWKDADAISNKPEVDEALRAFSDDPTSDNAVGLVLAVLTAAQPGGTTR